MANFAPTSEIQTPSDEDWRARPITPDRSMADLFSGITEGVKGVAQVGESMVKHDLYNQIYDTVSQANYSRISNTLDNMNPGGATNPELDGARATIGKMTTARQQGKMNDAQYWAGINVKAKELRARFPDSNQDIDEMFNQVTGAHTIESKLNQAVENSYYAGSQGKADSQKKWIDENFNKVADILAVTAPGSVEHFYELPQDKQISLLSGALKVKGQRDVLSADNIRLEHDTKMGAANKDDAKSVYSKTANQTVSEFMQGIAHTTGQDSSSLVKNIDLFANGGKPPTPEQSTAISQQLAQVKIALQQKFMQLRLQGGFDNMEGPDQEKIEQAAMAPLDKIIDLVNGGHYDLANAALHANNIAEQTDIATVRKAVTGLGRAGAVAKIGGPNAISTLTALPPKMQEQVTAVISKGFGTDVGAGNVSHDQVFNSIQADEKLSPAQKTAALTGVIDQGLAVQKSSDVSAKATKDYVAKNFANGGSGMQQVWEGASDKGKHNLFLSLTDPALGDNILKTNDPKTVNNYRDWVTDKFTSLPAARQGVGRIAEAFTKNNQDGVNYRYNPSLYRFEVVPPRVNVSQNVAGSPQVINSDARTQNAIASQAIAPFNDELQRLGIFLKHSGVDPNGPDGIAHVLGGMGLHGTNAEAAQRAIGESQLRKAMKPIGSENKEPEPDLIRPSSVGDLKNEKGATGTVIPDNAEKGADGSWYVPDAEHKGKYIKLEHKPKDAE